MTENIKILDFLERLENLIIVDNKLVSIGLKNDEYDLKNYINWCEFSKGEQEYLIAKSKNSEQLDKTIINEICNITTYFDNKKLDEFPIKGESYTFKKPFILMKNHIFEDKECQFIIDFLDDMDVWERAFNLGESQPYIRKSKRCVMSWFGLRDYLLEKIFHLIPIKLNGQYFAGMNSIGRFLKYEEDIDDNPFTYGDRHVAHPDFPFTRNETGCLTSRTTKVTLLISFNDVPTGCGGATNFVRLNAVGKEAVDAEIIGKSLARRGNVCLFEHPMIHEGQKIQRPLQSKISKPPKPLKKYNVRYDLFYADKEYFSEIDQKLSCQDDAPLHAYFSKNSLPNAQCFMYEGKMDALRDFKKILDSPSFCEKEACKYPPSVLAEDGDVWQNIFWKNKKYMMEYIGENKDNLMNPKKFQYSYYLFGGRRCHNRILGRNIPIKVFCTRRIDK